MLRSGDLSRGDRPQPAARSRVQHCRRRWAAPAGCVPPRHPLLPPFR